MKSRHSKKLAVVAIAAQWIASVSESAKAIRYVCAAHRDECNGFRYTAANEWRRAADLFALNTPAVEYCWRQWERIMNLPRRLAVPINDSDRALVEVAA